MLANLKLSTLCVLLVHCSWCTDKDTIFPEGCLLMYVWSLLSIHFDPVIFLLVKDVVKDLYSKILFTALFIMTIHRRTQNPVSSCRKVAN